MTKPQAVCVPLLATGTAARGAGRWLPCARGVTEGRLPQAVLSLLLTGRASPQALGSGVELGAGVTWRGPVGYLCWGRAPTEQQVRAPRPRYRRPHGGRHGACEAGDLGEASPLPGVPRAADAPGARLALRRRQEARRALRHRLPAPLRLEIGEVLPPVLLQRAAGADSNGPPHRRYAPELARDVGWGCQAGRG